MAVACAQSELLYYEDSLLTKQLGGVKIAEVTHVGPTTWEQLSQVKSTGIGGLFAGSNAAVPPFEAGSGFFFCVTSGKRTYGFRADSSEERRMWMSAIEKERERCRT